jgi:hypothetical protein
MILADWIDLFFFEYELIEDLRDCSGVEFLPSRDAQGPTKVTRGIERGVGSVK